MRRAQRKAGTDTLRPKAGEKILVACYASRPSEWFLATVLWAEGDEILTSHTPQSSCESCHQVLNVSSVACIGSLQELIEFQRHCEREFLELGKSVSDAEAALGCAREAMWAALDDLPKAVRLQRQHPEKKL